MASPLLVFDGQPSPAIPSPSRVQLRGGGIVLTLTQPVVLAEKGGQGTFLPHLELSVDNPRS
jgi:hypothetical protein